MKALLFTYILSLLLLFVQASFLIEGIGCNASKPFLQADVRVYNGNCFQETFGYRLIECTGEDEAIETLCSNSLCDRGCRQKKVHKLNTCDDNVYKMCTNSFPNITKLTGNPGPYVVGQSFNEQYHPGCEAKYAETTYYDLTGVCRKYLQSKSYFLSCDPNDALQWLFEQNTVCQGAVTQLFTTRFSCTPTSFVTCEYYP